MHRQNHGGGGTAGMCVEGSVICNAPEECSRHRAQMLSDHDTHTLSSRTLWPPQKQLCWQTPLALFSSRRGCNGTCVAAEPCCKGCAHVDGRPTVKRTTLQCKRHLCQPQHMCPPKDHELSQGLQMDHNLAKDNFGNMQCPCHLLHALGQSKAVRAGQLFCDSITQIRDKQTV